MTTDTLTRPRMVGEEAEVLDHRGALMILNVPGLPGDGSPVVLHVDEARGLTYTWQDQSTRDQDYSSRERGFLVSRLTVTHASGHEVASLNVTSTTKELVASVFASPFEWADANTHASFGYRWRKDGVTPQDLWAGSYNALKMTPPSMAGNSKWTKWTYSVSDAPTDPTVLQSELAVVEKIYAKQMRAFTRWLSAPFVDYAHVDAHPGPFHSHPEGHPGSLRGTGIGRQMYLLAARHLAATRGQVLRASGLQSDEAQALWQRLAADPTVPTRMTQSTFYKAAEHRTTRHLCLDYTRTISLTKDTSCRS